MSKVLNLCCWNVSEFNDSMHFEPNEWGNLALKPKTRRSSSDTLLQGNLYFFVKTNGVQPRLNLRVLSIYKKL